ncbi:PucR family transcriptional regulator ligand-binding domain-containing protein [Halobacillus yeomjeoni]|uniref:PucR family transcriptional regulator n=1 Tax=Halobacillus yeomjeoni TaxID=311194 RepID=UPI001CD7AFB2|nr:PucR family transcriptional regulator [Halobacillus yeomjeoni]MCA0984775.1 PucR family transcriptional regulator ligand-binding domain-containing protein [Halobacillus yeomjeoni]
MSVHVREVLQLPILDRAKLHTKLVPNQVEWISVIESPVENFVRNNEFVLSTGVGCTGGVEDLEGYVKDVIRSHASVLAIATGRHIYNIPDRVVKLAEEHNLILMEIPWEVRFGDILHEVFQLINLNKEEEKKRAESIRQELTNCVLNGKGLQEITEIVYQSTQIPIAISDHNKQVRANQDFDRYLIDALNGVEEITCTLESLVLQGDHPLAHYMEKYKIGEEVCYQLTILSNYKKQGYLLVQPHTESELDWMALTILDHALTACALYFVKENAIEMTEIRLKDNFLLELAKTEREIAPSLLSKAQLLGYDLDRDYICLMGQIHQKPNSNDSTPAETSTYQSTSIQSRNYYIQKEVTFAGGLLQRETMTTFDEGEVIIYLEVDQKTYSETARQFLDLIERRLDELLPGIIVLWGISSFKEGQYHFHSTYQEAKTALTMGGEKHEGRNRTFFNDTRMNRLLMVLSHEEEVASIVDQTLEKLVEYDAKRQTDLIHTFIVYNKYNSNVSQTARALNLHRQSLLHRLRNIEQLTGLSLLDADDLFLLELSVRLWMLKRIEK